MIPTIDERIDSMIQVMTTLIIPALKDSLAVDQAKLVVGHLAVLRDQVDFSVAFERLEYRAIANLAKEILAVVQGSQLTQAAAEELRRGLATSVPVIPADVRTHLDSLNAAIENLQRAAAQDGDPIFHATARALILVYSVAAAKRSRTWFGGMGFEPATGLSSISDMLREFDAHLAGVRQ